MTHGTALGVREGPGGAELFLAGISPVEFSRGVIARFDGETWAEVAVADGWPTALAVHDDGGGEALFAAGHFTGVDGVPSSRFARWPLLSE